MLQTETALELAAYDILEQAQKDNIRYMEIRFAPTLHTAGGLMPLTSSCRSHTRFSSWRT
jgi:adenosine deaminase